MKSIFENNIIDKIFYFENLRFMRLIFLEKIYGN